MRERGIQLVGSGYMSVFEMTDHGIQAHSEGVRI